MGYKFKTEDIWKNLSRFWTFYEERDVHTSVWDATQKILDGLNWRALQAFFAKSIRDWRMGVNSPYLNGNIKRALVLFGEYTGKARNIPMPAESLDFLPVKQDNTPIWIQNKTSGDAFQLGENEYFFPDLKNFTSKRQFFSPESGVDFVDDQAQTIVISDVREVQVFDHLIFVLHSTRTLKIFEYDPDTKKAVLKIDEDLKKKNGNNAVNVYDIAFKNDYVYAALGADGVGAYLLDSTGWTLTRKNLDSVFTASIDMVVATSDIVFVATGSNHVGSHSIWAIATFSSLLIGNFVETLVGGASIPAPSGTGYDQDGPAVYMMASNNVLSVFRGGSATHFLEQYDYSDLNTVVHMETSLGGIVIPDSSTLKKIEYFSSRRMLGIVWTSAGDDSFQVFSMGDQTDPKKLDATFDISDAEDASGDLTILDFDLAYDNLTFGILVKNGELTNQKIFLFDIFDLEYIQLVDSTGWPEDGFTSSVMRLGIPDTMVSLNDTAFKTHTADLGHVGEVFYTFDDLTSVDPEYFVGLNKHLHNHVNGGFNAIKAAKIISALSMNGHPPNHATDDDPDTYWANTIDSPVNFYVDFDAIARIVTSVSITPHSISGDAGVKDFKVYGSNDPDFQTGGAKTELHSAQNPNTEDTAVYSFNNTTAYRFYSLEVISTWHATYKAIVKEIKFFTDDKNGFSDLRWKLSYDADVKKFILEVTDFRYFVYLDSLEYRKKDLFEEDEFFVSDLLRIGANGDLARLRNYVYYDADNNGFDTYLDGGKYHSLDFELRLEEKITHKTFGDLQNKIYVTPQLGSIAPELMDIIKGAGLEGVGLDFFRNFTGKAVTLRSNIPTPFFVPEIVNDGPVPNTSSDYFMHPIRLSDSPEADRGYAIIQLVGDQKFHDNIEDHVTEAALYQVDGDFGYVPENTYIMGNSRLHRGRYKVEAYFEDLAIVTLEEQAPTQDEKYLKVPSDKFKSVYDASGTADFEFSTPIYLTATSGTNKIFIRTVANEVITSFFLQEFIGKILIVSETQPSLDSESHDDWLLVVGGGIDQTNGAYLILSKYITSLEIYSAPTLSADKAYLAKHSGSSRIDAMCWGATQTQDDENFFSPDSILFELFYTNIGIPNSDGRFVQNVIELKDMILDDVTGDTPETWYEYDAVVDVDSNGDPVFKNRYSQHKGLVIFYEKPIAQTLFATRAMEQLDTLSKIYAPFIGADENTPDSQEFYNEILGRMFSLVNGPNVTPLETGLNLFFNLPTNTMEETTIVFVEDRDQVVVRNDDGEDTIISLLGNPLRKDLQEGDVLRPLEPLTSKITIKDESIEPRWWDRDYITVISPHSQYRTDDLTQEQRRVMNEILKSNVFGVSIDASLLRTDTGRTIKSASAFVTAAKPRYSHAVVYTKMDLSDDPSRVGVSDSLTYNVKLIIAATIFSNLRNQYFTDDDDVAAQGEEMEMSRQNTVSFYDRLHLLREDQASAGTYTGWSQSDQVFGVTSKSLTDHQEYRSNLNQWVFKKATS